MEGWVSLAPFWLRVYFEEVRPVDQLLTHDCKWQSRTVLLRLASKGCQASAVVLQMRLRVQSFTSCGCWPDFHKSVFTRDTFISGFGDGWMEWHQDQIGTGERPNTHVGVWMKSSWYTSTPSCREQRTFRLFTLPSHSVENHSSFACTTKSDSGCSWHHTLWVSQPCGKCLFLTR